MEFRRERPECGNRGGGAFQPRSIAASRPENQPPAIVHDRAQAPNEKGRASWPAPHGPPVQGDHFRTISHTTIRMIPTTAMNPPQIPPKIANAPPTRAIASDSFSSENARWSISPLLVTDRV